MKIGIDARTLLRSPLRGIGKYLDNLLFNLLDLDRQNQYFLYYEEGNEILRFTTSSQVRVKHITIPKGSRFHLWEQLRLPLSIKKDKIELFHSPGNTTMLCKFCPTVVTIHDTILQEEIKIKDFYGKFYFNKLQLLTCRRCSVIIVPSEFTKKRVVEIFKIPEAKIRVIYQGIDVRFKVLEDQRLIEKVKTKYKVPDKYIFALGAASEWKNTKKLIEAYSGVKKSGKIIPSLVIVGVQNYASEEFKTYINSFGMLGQIILLNYVSEDDLVALYNGAVFFVYPTLFEGFGFPPLEAMACGTAVLASQAASIPEVIGDAGLLVDAKNKDELARGIINLSESKNLRNRLVEKGFLQVSKFSWKKTAEQTLNVYAEAKKDKYKR